MPDNRQSYGPRYSARAFEAGAAAFDLDADHRRNTEKVADAMHDRALGLNRSVCLRDVVTWLEGRTGYGGGFTSADDVRRAIALHFGGVDV